LFLTQISFVGLVIWLYINGYVYTSYAAIAIVPPLFADGLIAVGIKRSRTDVFKIGLALTVIYVVCVFWVLITVWTLSHLSIQ
jgi:hypothetical protein